MQSIYEHIKKRVDELGYANYSVQPVLIKTETDKLQYEINAYNELYFLMGQVQSGTRIVSDTLALEVDNSFNTSEIRNFYEFSGFIEITLSQDTTHAIEFLKVILS